MPATHGVDSWCTLPDRQTLICGSDSGGLNVDLLRHDTKEFSNVAMLTVSRFLPLMWTSNNKSAYIAGGISPSANVQKITPVVV